MWRLRGRVRWLAWGAGAYLAVTGLLWTAQQGGLLQRSPLATEYGSPYASRPEPAQYAKAIEAARRVALEVLARGVPGLAVGVAVSGDTVWSEGFGYADVEQRVPAGPSTRFRIGSISKPLTAAAVALLHEQGKLDLDAPIQRYVPGFPDKGQAVTTRLLAGHLAGIRHYRGEEFLIQKHYDSVPDALAIFKDDPLLHPPGTRFEYSSYGWNLISAVVEGASGSDFLSVMDGLVFAPLGMRQTVADQSAWILAQRARAYTRGEDGRLVNGPYVDNSYKWAGGGFLSTVEDLARFGSAHLSAGFLKPETLEMLFTSQRTSAGEETEYGIGWRVFKGPRGARRIAHTGGSIGGTSALLLYPDRRVVVAFLTNLTDAPCCLEEATRIADLFAR